VKFKVINREIIMLERTQALALNRITISVIKFSIATMIMEPFTARTVAKLNGRT
jgi:hypothetical protein